MLRFQSRPDLRTSWDTSGPRTATGPEEARAQAQLPQLEAPEPAATRDPAPPRSRRLRAVQTLPAPARTSRLSRSPFAFPFRDARRWVLKTAVSKGLPGALPAGGEGGTWSLGSRLTSWPLFSKKNTKQNKHKPERGKQLLSLSLLVN